MIAATTAPVRLVAMVITPLEPPRLDFAQLIADLDRVGITPYKLATMMHRQLIQVQRWMDGSEPRHYEGEMLRAIHARYCATIESSAP